MSRKLSILMILAILLAAVAANAQIWVVTPVAPHGPPNGSCVINSVNVTSFSGPQAATVDFSCTGSFYSQVKVDLILEGPAYAQYARVTSDAYGALTRTYPWNQCPTCLFPVIHPIPAHDTLSTTTNTFGRPFKAVATVRWDAGPISACASSGCLTNQLSVSASTDFYTP
jgi:hypothetical protein